MDPFLHWGWWWPNVKWTWGRDSSVEREGINESPISWQQFSITQSLPRLHWPCSLCSPALPSPINLLATINLLNTEFIGWQRRRDLFSLFLCCSSPSRIHWISGRRGSFILVYLLGSGQCILSDRDIIYGIATQSLGSMRYVEDDGAQGEGITASQAVSLVKW